MVYDDGNEVLGKTPQPPHAPTQADDNADSSTFTPVNIESQHTAADSRSVSSTPLRSVPSHENILRESLPPATDTVGDVSIPSAIGNIPESSRQELPNSATSKSSPTKLPPTALSERPRRAPALDYSQLNKGVKVVKPALVLTPAERQLARSFLANEAEVRRVAQQCLTAAAVAEQDFQLDALQASIDTAYVAAKKSKPGNMSFNKAAKKYGTKAAQSSVSELKQMIDMDIFRPTYWSDLSEAMKKKLIRSHTFFKEKYSVDGELEKLKARLVAGGNLVDASELGDIAAPTAKLESIMLAHAIASQFGYMIVVMDIPGAFLHTRLPKEERVVMLLGVEEVEVLLKLKPEWAKYRNDSGTMYVVVYGGLYGLPQAAMLWNQILSSALIEIGYKSTPDDSCVFVKFDSEGRRSIVIVHVDDLMHIFEAEKFQRELLAMLTSKFSAPTVHEGNDGIYVGIEYHYNRSDRSVLLSMKKYTDKLLADFNIQRGSANPTSADFMELDDDSPMIDKRAFASAVMSIYYLSLRVRRDILFAITVLAMRIHDCRENDDAKLQKLFRYIFSTRERSTLLRCRGTTVVFSIDASYAIHPNARSHSGLHVSLCDGNPPEPGFGGAIFCRSTVQKLVTLSSFEAELNAVHQNVHYFSLFRSLMSCFGFDQSKPSLLLQDNQATILALQDGKKFRGRSKHIDVRVYLAHELQQAGVIRTVHQNTGNMLADALTKPMSSLAHAHLLRRLQYLVPDFDEDDPWYQKDLRRRSQR